MDVRPGMSIADFGSGVGFYSLAVAKKVGPEGRVYAIDIHPDYLSKLKKEAIHRHLDNIETIRGDLESPAGSGLLGASVDRVIVSNILFQADDHKAVAIEAKRVLKPSGLAAVIDWSESFNQIGPHRDHIIVGEKVQRVFLEAGFELVSRLDAGSHHYGFLFRIPHVTI